MSMSTTATYTTHTGNLTLDRSQFAPNELAKLDQLNAAGVLQHDDILQFLDAHPDIKFEYVNRDDLEPPEQKDDEELPYDEIESDLNAILAQAQRAMMRAGQGLRRTFLEQAMAQREQIMDEAKQGLEKDLQATEKNYDAAVASAIAEGVAGAIQVGMAGKGMKDMRSSAKLSKRAEMTGNEVKNVTAAKHEGAQLIKKHEAKALNKVNEDANKHVEAGKREDEKIELMRKAREKTQADSKLSKELDKKINKSQALKVELGKKFEAEAAKMPGIQKTAADDAKELDRNMTANLEGLKKSEARDIEEAGRLTKGTMVWGQMGTSIGQIVNSVGHGINAELTLEAAEFSAHSKMDHAEQEMASNLYQQLMDLANAARDVINDMRNMQSSTSSSTQQLMSSIARNMA